jgi:hypothetical protein
MAVGRRQAGGLADQPGVSTAGWRVGAPAGNHSGGVGAGLLRVAPGAGRRLLRAELVPVLRALRAIGIARLFDLLQADRRPQAELHRGQHRRIRVLAVDRARTTNHPGQVEGGVDAAAEAGRDVSHEPAPATPERHRIHIPGIELIRPFGADAAIDGPVRLNAVAGEDHRGGSCTESLRKHADHAVGGIHRSQAVGLEVQVRVQAAEADHVGRGAPAAGDPGVQRLGTEPDVVPLCGALGDQTWCIRDRDDPARELPTDRLVTDRHQLVRLAIEGGQELRQLGAHAAAAGVVLGVARPGRRRGGPAARAKSIAEARSSRSARANRTATPSDGLQRPTSMPWTWPRLTPASAPSSRRLIPTSARRVRSFACSDGGNAGRPARAGATLVPSPLPARTSAAPCRGRRFSWGGLTCLPSRPAVVERGRPGCRPGRAR